MISLQSSKLLKTFSKRSLKPYLRGRDVASNENRGISVSTFFEGQQIGVCRGSFYWRRNRDSRSIELLDKRTTMNRNA